MRTLEIVVSIPRRWSWTITAALLALAGLLVWLVLAGRGGGAPALSGEDAGGAAPARIRIGTPVPRIDRTTGSPAAASHGEDEYEVCGGAWVKAGADGRPDADELRRLARRDDVARALDQALAADDRPYAQAARLWLQLLSGDAAMRESLARFATTTTDPDAYALAYRACGGADARTSDGACALLGAEQWARLAPANAAPWLEVFLAAQARNDTAAANEALHRIATSRRSEQGIFKLPGLVIDLAPDDDALRSGVLLLATDTLAAQGLPEYQPLVSACGRDQLRDSSRRQTCEAIADLMANKSDTLLERQIGGAIGRQAGWPEAQLERMRAEQQAYIAGGSDARLEPRDALSCAAIARRTAELQRKAELGEVGAMREWRARSAPR